MPVVEMPDGTQVEFPDDMPREQIRAMIMKKFPETNPEIGGKVKQFARGAAQGALFDPVEGIGQLIEHASGKRIPIPQSVRDWFDKVRENTEATTTGTVGRWTGALGSLAVAPEAFAGAKAASIGYRASRASGQDLLKLSQRLGRQETIDRISAYATKLGKHPRALTQQEQAEALLTRVPRAAASRTGRVAGQAAAGAAAGAAQPIEPGTEDYWTQKGLQALAGGSLAGLAGTTLGETALGFARHHPWYTAGAVFHPTSSIPTLAMLATMGGQRALERAGPVVAAPIGAAAGRVLSGGGEDAEATAQ